MSGPTATAVIAGLLLLAAAGASAPPPTARRPARYLVLTLPVGPSHTFVLSRLARELADRHADVWLAATAITADLATTTAGPRVRLLDVPLAPHNGILQAAQLWVDSWRARLGSVWLLGPFSRALAAEAEAVLGNGTFMDAATALAPDVVIGEPFDRRSAALAHALGAPLVLVNAGPPIAAMPEFERVGVVGTLVDRPAMATGWTPPLGYGLRLANAGLHTLTRALLWAEAEWAWGRLYRRHSMPYGGSKESLVIINADFALEWHMNLPPHVLVPGPLLPEPGSPLPADLASFVAPGAARGGPVVFASLGSSFTRGPDWAAQLVDELQAALPDARLLLKFTAAELGDAAVAALPPRVKVVRWAPQNDLLGRRVLRWEGREGGAPRRALPVHQPMHPHPPPSSGRVALFVTHGGANSMYEAAFHAVPMLVMPAGAEQADNAAKVVRAGLGLAVSARPAPADVARGVALAMERISILAKAARRVSHAMRSKRRPLTVAAVAIEHVAAVAAAGGDPAYLRPPSLDLSWPVRRGWDVGATVVGVVGGLAWGFVRLHRPGGGGRRAARSVTDKDD